MRRIAGSIILTNTGHLKNFSIYFILFYCGRPNEHFLAMQVRVPEAGWRQRDFFILFYFIIFKSLEITSL